MWTKSNFISFFRLLLSVPFGYLLWHNNKAGALGIAVLAVITDISDGWIARKYNEISEAGKIIDPLADKTFIGTAAVILVIKSVIPLWFGLCLVLRDILIVLGGAYTKGKIHYVMPSNYPGKATVAVLVVILTGVYFDLPYIHQYGIYIALAAMIISLSIYAEGMIRALRRSQETKQATGIDYQ